MTSRMVGSVLTLVILLFSAAGAVAQTYTQIQWGMNKGVTPYAFGANINGTWRDLGTVSSAGAWALSTDKVVAGAVKFNYGQYGVSNASAAFWGQNVVNGSAGLAALARVNQTTSAIAAINWSFCDGEGILANQACWGQYIETRRFPSSTGFLQGSEIDATDLSGMSPVAFTSYNFTPGSISYAQALMSGGDCGVSLNCVDQNGVVRTPVAVSAALRIGNNGASFLHGIVVQNTAISGADGSNTGGSANFMELARGHRINWRASDNLSHFYIGFQGTSTGTPNYLISDDDGVKTNAALYSSRLYLNNVLALWRNGNYTSVNNDSNTTVLSLGNASDKTNYHINDSHRFFASNGTTEFLAIDGTTATFNTPIKLKGYTVAGLAAAHPCNAGAEGSMAYVTDANGPTYNTTVAGGGTVKVPVFCDGANWTSH